MSVSDILCAFVADTRPRHLRAGTLAAARRTLIDAVGIMLGGTRVGQRNAPAFGAARAERTLDEAAASRLLAEIERIEISQDAGALFQG